MGGTGLERFVFAEPATCTVLKRMMGGTGLEPATSSV